MPLHISTPSPTTIVITRDFNAPRALVFDAWTKPDLVKKWCFGPDGWTMPICEIDLRVGGKWRWVWRKTGSAEEMAMTGIYKAVKAPDKLVNTENWGGPFPETVNTVAFAEKGGVTTTTLTIQYPSVEARDAAAKTGMADGLEMSYQRLDVIFADHAHAPGAAR